MTAEKKISASVLLSLLIGVFLAVSVVELEAEWRSVPGKEIYVNFPAGWKIHSAGQEKVVASNRAEEAFFLLRLYEGNKASDVSKLDETVRNELGSTAGEGERFHYAGRDAAYGEISFQMRSPGSTDGRQRGAGGRQSGSISDRQNGAGGAGAGGNGTTAKKRGFLLSVEDYNVDFTAVVFTSEGGFEAYEDMLLSTLDSVSLGHSGIVRPGPVSSFNSPYPSEAESLFSMDFEGKEIPVLFGEKELSLSQDFIEREARLLSLYQGSQYAVKAWKRYYRLIYRYQYARVAPIYAALSQHGFEGDESKVEIAKRLLSWVQGFEYQRLDTFSDCLSPMRSAVEHVGDCDSKSLLYVMLMHHFNIDAILMVSAKHSHSLAAVDVEGKGARFPYKNNKFLVAETTDDVKIGLIEKKMWNINTWVGIDFVAFRGSGSLE